MFVPKVATRHLRSSTGLNLEKPLTRTVFADGNLRIRGPTYWITLPEDANTISAFKLKLNQYDGFG